MPISREEISATVKEYLLRHPDEADRLEPLKTALAEADDPTSRRSLSGHVTVNAVLLDPQNRVLHIHHLSLNRWLTPGGHCEPEDSSLIGAALRELQEETGIPPESVQPLPLLSPPSPPSPSPSPSPLPSPVPEFAGRPIDIDVHAIPANDAKGEPGHWHYDFRFAFRAGDDGVDVGRLQAEEVTGAAWFPVADTTSPEIVRKLAAVL